MAAHRFQQKQNVPWALPISSGLRRDIIWHKPVTFYSK
jgi:hypothetical protein